MVRSLGYCGNKFLSLVEFEVLVTADGEEAVALYTRQVEELEVARDKR
jgi:hypothetical protein